MDSCSVPDEIERRGDVPFTDDGEPPLRLDLYRLRNVRFRQPRPVVMWIHGGGWRSGDKERGVERIFDALFPAQLHDCKPAVRFLRAHASEYDIDPERIDAWGASAGGHLASLLALTDRERSLEGSRGWATFSSATQAACSWFGPSDLNLSAEFPPDVTPRFPNLKADSVEGKLVGGPVAERQGLVEMANPIRHIHADAPPILLMHGAKDDTVPLASSERFHEAFVKRSVPSHLHVIKNGHHNAYLWGDHHLQLVNEFFEWHLRTPAA